MVKIDKNWKLPSLDSVKNANSEIRYFDFNLSSDFKELGTGKYFYLRTYGCQANERDSESISGILRAMGFTYTEDLDRCDLIVLNTCAVRKNAEDKVIGELGALKKYKKNKPNLIIALAGCMSQEEEVVHLILNKYRQVNLIIGTHNISNLPSLLKKCMIDGEKVVEVFSDTAEVVEQLPIDRFKDHKAWINIMYGCDKFCTYCIVPYTRGKQRSRRMKDILKEVKECLNNNFKEITLLGQNVNAYGKDFGLEDGFAVLLEEVAKTGIKRIRFVTSHPWDFSDQMVEVISKYENIMPYLHLPVQSGNNEILRKMGRRYTIEKYLELFDKINSKMDHVSFTSDIIVGFPGETEEQFQDTMKVVKYCKFDNIFSFVYSPREKTPAALMEDNVDMDTKKDRLYRLNEEFKIHSLENANKYINTIQEVLVDGLSKKDNTVYSGYTKTNKLVNFTSERELKIGDLVNVEISNAKTFTLDGKCINVISE